MERSILLLLIWVLIFLPACKKSLDTNSSITPANLPRDSVAVLSNTAPFPVTPLLECNNGPNYGDSIVYPQPVSNEDFYVYPQNNQGVNGTYLSWPAGLVLNSNTGAIDLTLSQTGQRYDLAFIKDGSTDTCMSQIIIGGSSYMDSVYVESLSDTTAVPYFNANPYQPAVCEGNQGKGCQFDYNDVAKKQGIIIDKKTGYIDLKKTMKKGIFGIHALNGTTVNTIISYRLDDQSNNAPQSLPLQIIYYQRKSDIPAALLSLVESRLQNTWDDILLSKGPSTRPPYIIIVRDN